MPTLPSKADKICKLAGQLQYNIDNWDARSNGALRAPSGIVRPGDELAHNGSFDPGLHPATYRQFTTEDGR